MNAGKPISGPIVNSIRDLGCAKPQGDAHNARHNLMACPSSSRAPFHSMTAGE